MFLVGISLLIFLLGSTLQAQFVKCDPVIRDDKLVLLPFELVELMMQDNNIKRSNLTSKYDLKRKSHLRKRQKPYEPAVSSSTEEFCYNLEESSSDEEAGPLARRKVWSRWSKWGGCSASCGGGAAVRRRLCVAGRCAAGELEEQRRTCSLRPCPVAADYD